MKKTIFLFLLWLASCATEHARDEEVGTASEAAQELGCEPYDESYCDLSWSCDVGSQHVQCADGMNMYAWRTPDCRWCINRDVCDAHMGPVVCPF